MRFEVSKSDSHEKQKKMSKIYLKLAVHKAAEIITIKLTIQCYGDFEAKI